MMQFKTFLFIHYLFCKKNLAIRNLVLISLLKKTVRLTSIILKP